MKRILLFASVFTLIAFIANAQSNRSLNIYEDGTSFFLAGLEEVTVENLTIEGWVKLDGNFNMDDYTALVDFRNASNADSKALIFKNSGGVTTSYEWNGNWTYVSGDNYVPTDEWVHVAVVVSGDDQVAIFYVNGYETGSNDTYSGLGDELPLGENIRVGAGLSTEPFRTVLGVMDEIRIWTVARSEDDILLNMNKEIDPASEGLLMYYKCNEEDGSDVLVDATGNGYDLYAEGGDYEFLDDAEWNTDVTSVQLSKSQNTISSYPNPVKDQLNFEGLNLEGAVLKIHDLSGRLVKEQEMSNSATNLTELRSGMYFYEINSATGLYNGKFIKE